MNWNFFKPYFEMIKLQNKNTLPQTEAVFRALVDAVIPKTPELAEKHGSIQSLGALDLHTDEYLIWVLDHQMSLSMVIKNVNIYLANATADMLNIAAGQLIDTGGNKKPINPDADPDSGMFAALEPADRFRAITLLEQLQVDLASLPVPFHNNPGFVLAVIKVLTLLVIKGYYLEWSGYGSTRLETPEKRKIEEFPTGWQQVGYPGPSLGYHVFRGNLVD